jgi:hypothetical protein
MQASVTRGRGGVKNFPPAYNASAPARGNAGGVATPSCKGVAMAQRSTFAANRRIDFSSKTTEQILGLYRDGQSARKIGLRLDVDRRVIFRVLRENGIQHRSRTDSIRKMTAAQEVELLAMRRAGATLADLTAHFDRGMKVIEDALSRNGARKRIRARKTLSSAEREMILDRYIGGESAKAIASEFGTVGLVVTGIVRRAGLIPRGPREASTKHTVNHAAFDPPLDDVKLYWMGMMATDGCIFTGGYSRGLFLSLAEKDARHVYAFREFLEASHPVHHTRRWVKLPNGVMHFSAMARCAVNSDRLAAALAPYGIVPNKCARLRISGGIEMAAPFWRGCIDGDGSVGIYPDARGHMRPTVQLCGTRRLMQQFCSFLRKVAPNYRGNPCSKKNLWMACATGHTALAFIRAAYGSSTIALARKLEIAQTILADFGAIQPRLTLNHITRSDLDSLFVKHGSWAKVAERLGVTYVSVWRKRLQLRLKP